VGLNKKELPKGSDRWVGGSISFIYIYIPYERDHVFGNTVDGSELPPRRQPPERCE